MDVVLWKNPNFHPPAADLRHLPPPTLELERQAPKFSRASFVFEFTSNHQRP
jgi:hypothetical protein